MVNWIFKLVVLVGVKLFLVAVTNFVNKIFTVMNSVKTIVNKITSVVFGVALVRGMVFTPTYKVPSAKKRFIRI